MRVSRYTFPADLPAPITLLQVSDLHNGKYAKLLSKIDRLSPDLICVTGDFLDRKDRTARGFAFLAEVASRYPTLVSLGNHEMKLGLSRAALAERVAQTGAIPLDNESTRVRGLLVGGLSSGYGSGERQGRLKVTPTPDLAFLDRFAKERGPKLLMCHHPEYYDRYLTPRDTGLILAGHAHGGQWRLFGRGLFAPGQGLFPRYTAGLYHGRLIVSRGLCATHRYIPRIFNPRELVAVTFTPK